MGFEEEEDLKITKFFENYDSQTYNMLRKWFHSPTPLAIAYLGFGECHMNIVCEFVSKWFRYNIEEITDTWKFKIRLSMRISSHDFFIKKLGNISKLYKHGKWLNEQKRREYIMIRYITFYLCLRSIYCKNITRMITRQFARSLKSDFQFIDGLKEMPKIDAQKIIYKRLKRDY